MDEEKKSWDDIPSLGELQVDWNYEPASPLGKRQDVRLDEKELGQLFDRNKIFVKIATQQTEVRGVLADIAQSGLGVLLPKKPRVAETVEVVLSLKRRKIISKAIVRNAAMKNQLFRVGLEFVDLSSEIKSFLATLIPTKRYLRDKEIIPGTRYLIQTR